jgi:hypothetical protein
MNRQPQISQSPDSKSASPSKVQPDNGRLQPTLPLRKTAVLQMQQLQGNAYVQRQLAGRQAADIQRTCMSPPETRDFLRTFEVARHVEQEMDQQILLARARSLGQTTAVNAAMIQTADTAIRQVFGSLLPAGRQFTAPQATSTITPAQFAQQRVPDEATARRRIAQAAFQYAAEDLEIACISRADHPLLLSEIVEPILSRRRLRFVRDYEGAHTGGVTHFPQVQGQTAPHVTLPDASRNMGHIVVHEALHFYVSDIYRQTAESGALRQELMEGGAEFLARHVINQQLSQQPDFQINPMRTSPPTTQDSRLASSCVYESATLVPG